MAAHEQSVLDSLLPAACRLTNLWRQHEPSSKVCVSDGLTLSAGRRQAVLCNELLCVQGSPCPILYSHIDLGKGVTLSHGENQISCEWIKVRIFYRGCSTILMKPIFVIMVAASNKVLFDVLWNPIHLINEIGLTAIKIYMDPFQWPMILPIQGKKWIVSGI